MARPSKKKSSALVCLNHKNDPEEEDLISGLKPKELSFALHIVTCNNLVEAYTKAGYSGTSFDNVMSLATELAEHPRVRDVVNRRREQNNKRYQLDANRVLQELAVIAYSDHDDYETNAEGNLVLRPGIDPRASRAISGVKKRTVVNHRTGDVETVVDYLLHNKTKALELLARANGLLITDLPPLEVLLARLPNEVSEKLRDILASGNRLTDGQSETTEV